MNYFPRFAVVTVSVAFFLIFGIVHADSGIYTWKDESGALVFTDNPTLAPEGITAKRWSATSSEQKITIVHRMEETVNPSPEILVSSNKTKEAQQPESIVRTVSQGAFAIQLIRELGLGQNLSARDAAQTLSDIRISPALGEWFLERAMTPALTTRLRTLTVSAPQMGWISITPEQALLAFDTAAALTGLPIPLAAETENENSSGPTVSVPPLVYINPPPPEIITSYVWVPVLSGFSFYDRRVHGYYVLRGPHLKTHRFKEHRFAFNRHVLQRHFDNHLSKHRDGQEHVILNPSRDRGHSKVMISPPSHPIRHRKNMLHNRNARPSHLRKSHNKQERIHHQSEKKGHEVVHHPSSGARHHIEPQHVVKKSHSTSRGHRKAQTHTSPRHSRGGRSHNGGHIR